MYIYSSGTFPTEPTIWVPHLESGNTSVKSLCCCLFFPPLPLSAESDREDGSYCPPPVKRERTSSLTQFPPSQSGKKRIFSLPLFFFPFLSFLFNSSSKFPLKVMCYFMLLCIFSCYFKICGQETFGWLSSGIYSNNFIFQRFFHFVSNLLRT